MRDERVEEAPVHGVGGARNEVRLVDQHQVALLHVVGAAVDRLDAGEQHLRPDLPPAEPGRVDAGRRVGPQPHHLGVVLGDQLAHVGDHEDALVGPLLQHALDERAITIDLPPAVGITTSGCPSLWPKYR